MQFAQDSYEINEIDRSIIAVVLRSGDLSQSSSVRCYTRQATAEVTSDYAERPNTNASIITFEPGKCCCLYGKLMCTKFVKKVEVF